MIRRQEGRILLCVLSHYFSIITYLMQDVNRAEQT